jgi:hypothetical protein
MTMQTAQITSYAHALYRAHGARAEAEAARRAQAETDAGHTSRAATWQRIRRMIRELR